MKSFIRKKIIIGKKAFSLIELSVAIVILSIVVAGMLSVSTNAVINDKAKKTKDNIDLIYSALGVYLLKNGAMPCPAPITSVKSTDANYGYSTGDSGLCANQDGVYSHQNSVYGMVPIKNLDLPSDVAEDGFGNKFGYLIYNKFIYNKTTSVSLFGISSSNAQGIDIKNQDTSLVASTELAMFAIISYGANKYGAFNANSATQNSASTLAAEQTNYPTLNINTATFSNSAANKITINASSATTSFDDIVFFKTRNDMVRDFNALFLIKCPVVTASAADANAVSFGGTYFAWTKSSGIYEYGGEYGEAATSNTECPTGWKKTVGSPTRRCGAFGQWEAGGASSSSIAAPCTQ